MFKIAQHRSLYHNTVDVAPRVKIGKDNPRLAGSCGWWKSKAYYAPNK